LVITGNFEAVSNTPCAIHIAGLNRTNLGISCSVATNFSTVITYLKPYQPYKLTLTGDSVYFAHLDLLAPTVLDLTVAKMTRGGIPNAPKEFKIFIDGVEKYSIDDYNSGGCATYSKTFFVEIRPDNDVQRRNSAGQNDDFEVPEER